DKNERAIVATTDPKTLPDLSTWSLVTNLPAEAERRGREPLFPPADLEEVLHLYGLRRWVEQSYKHVKHALGWSQYQVRSDQAIRRHWQRVCGAFSFCWYHASHSCVSRTADHLPKPAEPEISPETDVPTERGKTGKKNQRAHKHEAAGVLADGPASSTRLVGALDHAAALLERLVVTAPTSCSA